MATAKTDIYVYAHWKGLSDPQLIGILSAHAAKGRKAFSFEYTAAWLKSAEYRLLDPDIQFYGGPQFPNNKENFGLFLDSMPDTWGRTLMKRRAAQEAAEKGERAKTLYEVDYLLGVLDESRMGALRFKTDPNGPFLDNNEQSPTPPWSSVAELQEAASNIENETNNDAVKKWLAILIAPGSSLGGARPKANILDKDHNLWIAKFPAKNDTIDKAAWEYLAWQLALKAGINMSECRISKVAGKYNTFFTKRFDREQEQRIHFASAMTMTGNNEDTIRDNPASYLEMAEFIQNHGTRINEHLEQLWRRIVFNIAISNTDDHLRNHGFLLTEKGWVLSPAYDINPSIDKDGLALNIDMDNNALDYELAKSVGPFFRLDNKQMDRIIDEVTTSVKNWRKMAKTIGISNSEQDLMAKAFHI
ncbi:serine/threonine-protein kinase HipA [Draconibacterium orientale]|uniref:Serine/threonine-protein kinase HipA n=1 Tax=Draconibacterium orientale TaxID=1168034 RepID=X5DZF6_9BACT|nr:HipA domain-containing protein [Draconibacterium orientale]AHW60625.1 toxin HipA [Draconibacterium orientale]SET05873.1 serine/threonine-protein kinase HipA [Draconibacterium orientale]